MPEIDVDHKNISISVKRGESFSVIHPRQSLTVDHSTSRLTVEHPNNSVRVSREDKEVQVTHPDNTVSVYNGGKRGIPGVPGEGIPSGGSPGEVIVKTEDGTAWAAFEGADKNYTSNFMPTDNLVVNHNLNKYPSVSVINTAGDEVIGNVTYLTLNSIIVSFSAPFGGRVTCN